MTDILDSASLIRNMRKQIRNNKSAIRQLQADNHNFERCIVRINRVIKGQDKRLLADRNVDFVLGELPVKRKYTKRNRRGGRRKKIAEPDKQA